MKQTKTAGWNTSETQLLHVASNFVEVWSFSYSLLPRSFGVICCNVFSIGYSVCGDKIILHTTHAPCTTLLKAFVHIVWSLHYFAFEKDEAPKVVSFLGGENMVRGSCGFRGEAFASFSPHCPKVPGLPAPPQDSPLPWFRGESVLNRFRIINSVNQKAWLPFPDIPEPMLWC